jgi:hypothetical protein
MPEYILVTDPDGMNRVIIKDPKNINFITRQNDAEKAAGRENKMLKIGQTFPNEESANAYVMANKVVHGHSAVPKVATLQTALRDSQNEIEVLKAKLAAAENKVQSTPFLAPPAQPTEKLNVIDTLAKIKNIDNEAELKAMFEGETRDTVLNALNKAIEKIKLS